MQVRHEVPCFTVLSGRLQSNGLLPYIQTALHIRCPLAGEALEAEQPAAPAPAKEGDDLFCPPELVSSGTGAKVLFTTADRTHAGPAAPKAATLHIWNQLL